jgi:hypothetical protein
MNMRLLGAPTLADVVPSMVDASALNSPNGEGTMFDENCELARGLLWVWLMWVDERMRPVSVKSRL